MAENRVEINPELTAIALTYRNKRCIADEAFHKVNVTTSSFKYYSFNKNNYFSVPDTLIGEKGQANKVELKGTILTSSVQDHALEEVIPVATQKETLKAEGKIDLKAKATSQLTDLLLLRKEIEFVNFLSDTSNYGTNVTTLGDDEKIDNEDTNAVKLIQNAIDAMLYKANRMVLSRKAASALRMNPYIVDACGTAAKKAGIVPLEALKDLFELDKILIGESVYNTAKRGQKISLETCFGDNISLLYIDETASVDYGVSFGYQCIKDDLTIGEYHDGSIGTQGADILKAYYSNKFLSTCPECGYFIQSVIS